MGVMMETPRCQRRSLWEHCCMSPFLQACKHSRELARLQPDYYLYDDEEEERWNICLIACDADTVANDREK